MNSDTDDMNNSSAPYEPGDLTGAPLDGLYDVIHRRRDVRREFTGEPADPAALSRILHAAHSAPSVGLTQPWDFILIDQDETKKGFWEHVQDERQTFASQLEGEAAERFGRIKIDGIMESTLSIVVTYDSSRGAPSVLGRHAIADAGLYSVCLAIQNLWLACTAENWGVGWVSFYREEFLSKLLEIPGGIRPVAWLCVGPVGQLQQTPDLERHGWRCRGPLEDVLHYGRFGNKNNTPAVS